MMKNFLIDDNLDTINFQLNGNKVEIEVGVYTECMSVSISMSKQQIYDLINFLEYSLKEIEE